MKARLSWRHLSENARAKRPIIEFGSGLNLYNHGTTGKLVNVIDTSTTDALSDIQGQTGATLDGTELRNGDKIVFTQDPDVRNKILTVSFTTISSSVVIHLVDDSTTVPVGQSIVAKRGTNNKGKTYHLIDLLYNVFGAVKINPLIKNINSSFFYHYI